MSYISLKDDVTRLLAAQPKKLQSLQIADTSTSLPLVPARLLEFEHLVSLSIMRCGLRSVPRGLARSLPLLQTLSLSGNLLTSIPDLTGLTELYQLDLTGNKLLDWEFAVSTVTWLQTREALKKARRRFYFEATRMAALIILGVKKFRPSATFSRCLARDLNIALARAIWQRRSDPVARAPNKWMHDMELYHCAWPVPFVTLAGPSCFTCHCGLRFGDPTAPLDMTMLKATRNAHFVNAYHSAADGRCTATSKHYPLNRVVLLTMNRHFPNSTKRTPEHTKTVTDCLVRKSKGHIVGSDVQHTYRTARFHSPGNTECIFVSEIQEDLNMCIDDFLRLRAQTEPSQRRQHPTVYGVFSRRAELESVLLHKAK